MSITSAEQHNAAVIETHSLDPIPASERYGTASSLFTFWFSSNLVVGSILTGAGSALVGLPLAWTIVSIILGQCLGAILMALHSAQGPKLGIPQMIQSRAQFGFIGAAITIIPVIIMYVGYFAAADVMGGTALSDLTGLSPNVAMTIVGVAAGLLALYGYHLLHTTMRIMIVVCGIAFAVLTIGMFVRNDLHASFSGGAFSWSNFMVVMGISIGWQLTYMPYVADYSRYLPESTPIRQAFWYTFAGIVSSSIWLFVFGAIGSTIAADAFANGSMTVIAGQAGFATSLFLLIFILSLLPTGALTGYGGFMSLSTLLTTFAPNFRVTFGLRAVIIVVVTALSIVIATLGAGDFLNNLLKLIYLITTFLVPWSAINLVDFYLVRRERYDIPAIFDPNGIYAGFDWRALTAYFVGIIVGLPFTATTIYTGPIAERMGGVDLTWIVSAAVSAGLFYGLVSKWPVRNGVSAFDSTSRAIS